MTGFIIVGFVPNVQKTLKDANQEPRALLLLDNCPAHPPADCLVSKDGKVKIMYLPKNITALIQPLDQGIIHAFKTNYRREMLKSLLASDVEVSTFLKTMNFKDVSYNIGLSWQAISRDTIKNCWKKLTEPSIKDRPNVTISTLDAIRSNLFTNAEISNIRKVLDEPELTNSTLMEWINIEAGEDICQQMTDKMIIQSVCREEDSQEQMEDEIMIESTRDTAPMPQEALAAMEIVMKWTES
ncbi:DDE superfamily endonuclease [Popillia japonica]|uniref:DDE superfamily endonuclease n=1 Tax=Popillia japonica TaxID=7064 RepID=A0AAW1KNV7_POPJA